jgi:hypothetical protein
MPEPKLSAYEKIIRDVIAGWNGWPAPDWVVDNLRRKHKWTEKEIQQIMRSLRDKGVIAFVTHKEETVVRIE